MKKEIREKEERTKKKKVAGAEQKESVGDKEMWEKRKEETETADGRRGNAGRCGRK